jgi:hypothetical protein
MNTHNLKPGDRVRVTERCRVQGYQLGDKGTVWRAAVTGPIRTRHYMVVMDKNGAGKTAPLFAEDEIEPDV